MNLLLNTVFSVFYNYWKNKGRKSPHIEASYYMAILLFLNLLTAINLYITLANKFNWIIFDLNINYKIILILTFYFFVTRFYEKNQMEILEGKKITKYSNKVIVTGYMLSTLILFFCSALFY